MCAFKLNTKGYLPNAVSQCRRVKIPTESSYKFNPKHHQKALLYATGYTVDHVLHKNNENKFQATELREKTTE